MNTFRQYVSQLITIALITGILCNLSEKTTFHKQMRLVSSLLITLSFLGPVAYFSFQSFDDIRQIYIHQAESAAAEGVEYYNQSVAQFIKSEAASYIQKEAAALGANISVQVNLDSSSPPIPIYAEISGFFSDNSRDVLSNVLIEKFGIPKEHQTWIRMDSPEFGSS